MKQRHNYDAAIASYCALYKLPLPVGEHRFASPRLWRFDYAWKEQKVALEVEGGAWRGGRHTRGKGFTGDMEKYNRAVKLGWRVLRFTPDQLRNGEAFSELVEILEATDGH